MSIEDMKAELEANGYDIEEAHLGAIFSPDGVTDFVSYGDPELVLEKAYAHMQERNFIQEIADVVFDERYKTSVGLYNVLGKYNAMLESISNTANTPTGDES